MSSRMVASASAGSGITASARASSGVRTARNAFSAVPVAAERRGPCLHRADARPFDDGRPRRFAVDVGLQVFPTEFVARRLRAVNAEAVLRQVSTIGCDEPAQTGFGDQALGHGRDRVGDVVVPWPTGEGQAACDRQRSARVADRKAQFVGGYLYRRGEARVDVDHVEIVDADTGQLHRSLPGDPDRRRAVELRPLADRVGVVRVGARIRENPTLRGNLQIGRLLDRGQHQRRALVDHVVRIHQLGVGPADHPVAGTGLPDLVGANGSRLHACGFFAATALNCDHSPPMRRRCSSGDSPAAIRNACSNIGYT